MLRFQTLGSLRLVGPRGDLLAGRRKELVLLAYLARSTPRAVPRAELAALLWGERPEANARQSLRQALLHLKRALPEHLNVRSEAVTLSGDGLECDVVEFERDLSRGELRRGVQRWGGDFLHGTEDAGGESYRIWLEAEREALRRRLSRALERLLQDAANRRRWPEAVVWAERWTASCPSEEEPHRWLLQVLRHAGRTSDAVARHASFVVRLRREYDLEPSAGLVAFGAELQRTNPGGLSSPIPALGPADPEWTAPRLRWKWALVAAGGLAFVAAAGWLATRPAGSGHAVLAVGAIRNLGGPDSAAVTTIVPELLATNLARLPELEVISNARMLEVRAQLGATGGAARVARHAGANALLEGDLLPRRGGGFRLDLRLIDLKTGAILGVYRATADDPYGLVDSVTAVVATSLRRPAPRSRVADVTTSSLVAYRLYEEGLRAYYDAGDPRTANRLFLAALEEDSTFAMAAFYAAATGSPEQLPRAVQLSTHATDRERLLIRAYWANANSDPGVVGVAESLAERYPAEPEGHLMLGQALLTAGDFVGSATHYRRAYQLDSLSLEGRSAGCLACDALYGLVAAEMHGDSLAAAERTAREWIRRQPRSGAPWFSLALVLNRAGRFPEMLEAGRTAVALRPAAGYDWVIDGALAGQGDFEAFERRQRERMQERTPSQRSDQLGSLEIIRRWQGRLSEALALERAIQRQESRGQPASRQYAWDEAQILFELGRYRESADLWAEIARLAAGQTPSSRARGIAWQLTHAADALAGAGDTAALRTLVDTVEFYGRLSGYGRDQRLHYHVEGLLLRLRGRNAEAAEAFRRALFGLHWFTRTNLELGKALLATHRPAEAIPVLQAGARGSGGWNGLYTTATEFHELLGYAFEAAGQPDSAAANYRWVLHAWERADPVFRARREAVRARLAALETAGNTRRGNGFRPADQTPNFLTARPLQ